MSMGARVENFHPHAWSVELRLMMRMSFLWVAPVRGSVPIISAPILRVGCFWDAGSSERENDLPRFTSPGMEP